MARYGDLVDELRSVGKTNYGAPAYSRWINRPLGRRLAALAYLGDLTPNQVTGLSGLSSLVAVGLIAWPQPTLLSAVGITALLVLGYALDSADGQLARLRGGGSPSGEWLDHMVDTAKTVLVHGAVLVAYLRWSDSIDWRLSLVPLGFILASIMAFFGWQLAELLSRRQGDSHDTPTSAPVLRSLLRSPSDWGIVSLSFLTWSTVAFPVIYTLLMLANLVIMLAALPVWYRKLA